MGLEESSVGSIVNVEVESIGNTLTITKSELVEGMNKVTTFIIFKSFAVTF
jgi:hypothetical protein